MVSLLMSVLLFPASSSSALVCSRTSTCTHNTNRQYDAARRAEFWCGEMERRQEVSCYEPRRHCICQQARQSADTWWVARGEAERRWRGSILSLSLPLFPP